MRKPGREENLSYIELMNQYQTFEMYDLLDDKLTRCLNESGHKIILIGDSGGTLTVGNVPVFFEWGENAVFEAFAHPSQTVYFASDLLVVSNKEINSLITELGRIIEKMSQLFHKKYVLVSYFHSATEMPSFEKMEAINSVSPVYRGIILVPGSLQEGIYTYNDLQYMKEGDALVLDREKLFRWQASSFFGHHSVISLSVEELRTRDVQLIKNKLLSGAGYPLVIVNALNESDLKIFTIAVLELLQEGFPYLFQSSGSFIKVISGSLSRNMDSGFLKGKKGIVLNPSVSDSDLSRLAACGMKFNFIKFKPEKSLDILMRIQESEKTVFLYVGRIGMEEPGIEELHKRSLQLIELISVLHHSPDFIVFDKGLSIAAATSGLRISRTYVLGQIEKGMTVWKGSEESALPETLYIMPARQHTQVKMLQVIYACCATRE